MKILSAFVFRISFDVGELTNKKEKDGFSGDLKGKQTMFDGFILFSCSIHVLPFSGIAVVETKFSLSGNIILDWNGGNINGSI